MLYLKDADSKSRLRFFKFRLQNPFLGKFGPKNSKLSILSENQYTWYLRNVDSKSGWRVLKFRPQNPFLGKFGLKKSKLSVFRENWHAWHLDDADSYSSNSFPNYQPQIHFWANGLKKVKLLVLPENLQTHTCTHNISKMLIYQLYQISDLNLDADSYSGINFLKFQT